MVDKVRLSTAAAQEIQSSLKKANRPEPRPIGPNFEETLAAQLGRTPSVRFSAHAQQRLERRNIIFGGEEALRLEQAVEKAAGKGSRESLILMDDLALIVSVRNRLVITALDADRRKENVFTNIDSVVLT